MRCKFGHVTRGFWGNETRVPHRVWYEQHIFGVSKNKSLFLCLTMIFQGVFWKIKRKYGLGVPCFLT